MIFSILTVVKNGEATIRQCLDSVRALQERSSIEIEHIVIDGASTDNTVKICSEYAVRIYSQVGTGIYSAMNQAVSRAKGDYCIFLNSDDFLLVDEACDLFPKVFARSSSHVHLCGIRMVHEQRFLRDWLPSRTVSRRFCMPYPHPGMIFHRSLFVSFGLAFQENLLFSADYDQALRVLKFCVPIIHDVPISVFRTGGASESFQAILENLRVRKAHKIGIVMRVVGFIYDVNRMARSYIHLFSSRLSIFKVVLIRVLVWVRQNEPY